MKCQTAPAVSWPIRWAFPRDAHEQLLIAAIGSDRESSCAAAYQWLTENDLETASSRDQRLLLAIVGRLNSELSHHRAYRRLVGMQKLLWSRSLLSLQEAKRPLQQIALAGHPILLIKGAARLSSHAAASKLRVGWDVDFVVRREGLYPAFDTLIANDWQASPGTSPQYLRQNLESIRSLNFYKGNFGDIDLHSQPFHPGQGGPEDDQALWNRSVDTMLGETPVLVPCAEDRIALAIGHSGLDGHSHSDWLVDCASILEREPVNWNLLAEIISSRGLQIPAAVVFHYFQGRLGINVPSAFLLGLSLRPYSQPIKTLSGLVQVRPKDRFRIWGQVVRLLVKSYRKRSSAKHLSPAVKESVFKSTKHKSEKNHLNSDFVKSFAIPLPSPLVVEQPLEINLVLDIKPFHGRRRVEFEINSPTSHGCRIRYRRWFRRYGAVRLQARGTLAVTDLSMPLTLASRPNRQLRPYATDEERRNFGSLGFRVVSCKVNGRTGRGSKSLSKFGSMRQR